jgi:hypothetical protein
MSTDIFEVPSENDFLAAFGIDALESIPEDGFWTYEFIGHDKKCRLILSFNTHETSIQTMLETKEGETNTIVHEDARKLAITNDDCIEASFWSEKYTTTLHIRIFPKIKVTWSILLAK